MNTCQVKIERLGLEGQGVGYDSNGNIYFVPGTIPGDLVEVQYEDTRKRYRDAELVSINEASSLRVNPECKYFNECGGCDWQNMSYDGQKIAKEAILKHAIERGGFQSKQFESIVPAEEIWGYRRRVQLRRNGDRLGFYRKRSHDVVDVESCPVAHPKLNAAIQSLRADLADQKPEKIELTLTDEGEVRLVKDRAHSAEGFLQINTRQNDVLKQLVSKRIELAKSKKVLELFSGNGNLTFSFASLVNEVIAADSNAPAIQDAKLRSENLKSDNAPIFLRSEVDAKLLRMLPTEFRNHYDTLLLDPPRTGAGDSFSSFVRPNVKNIIYVSCSPASFSKDIQLLKKEFTLSFVQALDMFPHTKHIEFVAHFTRR